ncbi:MAG: DNA internalization-related competence protein ComEC/Rec2 [Desulfonatronovibrionaceae bacterium]
MVAAYITGIWGLCYPIAAGFILLIQALLWVRSKKSLFFCAAAFGLGLLAADLSCPQAPEQDLPEFVLNRDKVRISGIVTRAETKPGRRQRLVLDRARIKNGSQGHVLPGKMVVNWYDSPRLVLPGQEMSFESRVKPVHSLANQGVWNGEFYWEKQGVFWRSYAVEDESGVLLSGEGTFWSRMRMRLMQGVREAADSLEGGWSEERVRRLKGTALALLFGERYYLEPDFVDRVRRASLGHTLALSGMHLGMLVLLGWLAAGATGALFPRVYLFLPRPRLAFCLAVPLCFLYVWLGQAPHSLVRSGLMFFFWGALVWFGRSRNLSDALFAALAVILAVNPLAVFDLSLQLSALAVAGICVFQPLMARVLKKIPFFFLRPVIVYLLGLSLVTLAVNIFLLPVQAWTFGYLSRHLYLNLIWIPALGLFILPLFFFGLFASLFIPATAPFFFWLAGSVLNPLADFLSLLDERLWLDPFLILRPGWGIIAAYYFFLLLIVSFFCYRKIGKAGIICAVLVSLAAVAPYIPGADQSIVRLQLMDVGQGQCVFLRSRSGELTIVDGGGSWNLDYDLGRRVVAPAMAWRRWPSAKNCILSHGDMDHMRGLYYPLAHARIERFWFNGIWPDKVDGQLLAEAVRQGAQKVRVLQAGDRVPLDGGLHLEILHPQPSHRYDKSNNNSLVLRLTYKGRGLALIPGDIEKKAISDLLDSGVVLDADVLILPHHGSKSSFSPRFYQRVDPEVCLVSAGFLNYFRLPNKRVSEYLFEHEIPLLSTSGCGQIDVSFNRMGKDFSLTCLRGKEDLGSFDRLQQPGLVPK